MSEVLTVKVGARLTVKGFRADHICPAFIYVSSGTTSLVEMVMHMTIEECRAFASALTTAAAHAEVVADAPNTITIPIAAE